MVYVATFSNIKPIECCALTCGGHMYSIQSMIPLYFVCDVYDANLRYYKVV